jgi:hypothetical protein
MRATKVPAEVWIQHHPKIEHLNILEGRRLECEDRGIQIMKAQHSFSARYMHADSAHQSAQRNLAAASKSQFEERF